LSYRGVTAIYNGIDLSDYWEYITDIRRDAGNEDDLITEDTPMLGEQLLRISRGAKVIEVDFTIWSNDRNKVKRQLARIFRVESPKKLIFSDEPDKYYLAIKSGKIEMREETLKRSTGTITFYIEDGVAHSTTYKRYDNPTVSGDKITFEINNEGSEYAYPIITIKHNSENGYIGVVNATSAMEVGNKEEVDGVTAQKNVTLHKNEGGDFSDWTDGTKNYENTNKIINAKMTSDKAFSGRLGLISNQFATSGTAGAYQYGAVKELPLAETAKNWYIWARAWFETGLMGQTGAWCLSVIDENDHFIAGMAIEKNDASGNTAQIRFLLGDGKGGSRVVQTINFTPSLWFPPNPYGSEGRQENKNANMFDLLKEGDTIKYYWYGSSFRYSDAGIRDVKAKKVQFFVGQYAGRNTTDRMVTHHYINYFLFEKLHVDYWKDVPNRYPMGSNVVLSSEDVSITMDGLDREMDFVYGSNFVEIPPGKSTLEVYTSSWCKKPPTVTVEFEERWL